MPLCLLAALSLFIPSASTISEENVDVNVNLVNGVAIRILNSAATAEITELDLSATAAPTGTFVTDNFKVEVSTANKTGYKLYMNSSYQNPSTSTYTTDLVNQTNTSYTIPTIVAATTKADLSTAAPGTTNANKWAYSLDDTTYSPVPANSVQTQIGSHDTPTAGTKTPVYIGMNVNVEKPSGVYKNQLTFSSVGNPITTDYSLYFLQGTTETVTGLPPTQTASVVAASHTFTIPTLQQYSPTRDGYNFTGYLDESTSTTYQPGDTITVQGDIDYTGSATLTAQWEVAIHYIQNQTYIDECKAAATGTEFELTDSRDNNEYTVAKLADGKCWMTENLKLVGNATVGYTDLTTTDSDVPTAGFRLTSSNSGTWCTTNSADCDNQSMVLNSGDDSYGTYYNWYAATAGTGTYETSTDGTSVANSICPRGWRLPTGGSSGEFQTLYGYYSSASAMMSSPVNFVLSGYRNGSSTYDQGSYGYYWSSTAFSSNYAYSLYLSSSYVNPADFDNKYRGLTVRCVAR
ncbi:fibrobacter succinogenes major paralogous domain-containing protein [Candidatus Saccharibacteria bacterium]|nr:fibrobacter succinogenes major paralogous domain-containing protein [Candidatus Saccharibacteria bacterium]